MQATHDQKNDLVIKKRGRLSRILMGVLPVIVLAGGVLGFMAMGAFKPKPKTKKEAPKAAPVVVVAAQGDTLVLDITTQGEVRPRDEINVATQVGGKIVYLSPNFIEGGQFHKGDVLLKIEPADYDLELTRAQANVAQAETLLTRELSEADIAKRDWQDLGEGEPSALTLREPQLAEAKARLLAAKATLAQAQLQKSRTVVRAPFNGSVKSRLVSAGEYIAPGQKLGRIYNIGIFEVKIPLTDTDLSRMGVGIGFKHSAKAPAPMVELSAHVAGKNQVWQGRLVRIDRAFDSATRTIFGYVQVNNPYGQGGVGHIPLAAGLFVDAKIKGREVKEAVVVPRAALRGKNKIYVANNDDTLSIKTVHLASSNKDKAIITHGLVEGDMVITSPVRGVAEGMKIAPTNVEPANTAINSEIQTGD